VTVAVATLWRSPASPRAVDARALRSPADIRGWLSAMTLAQRRQLVGRADTQALLGDRVVVLSVSGAWAHVAVPDQPTPLDRRGYPGWVPARQLSAVPPAPGPGMPRVATVVASTTWLRSDDNRADRVTEVSYGTTLPVLGTVGSWTRVALPGGRSQRVTSSAVARHAPGTAALPASGTSLVRSAQAFTGLPYLWAGRSGFGFDCSGLTSLVLGVHGITIARDADAQAAHGTAVPAAARAPGDLLFYATSSGRVHHVSMYAGQGLMVQSPATGGVVETIPTSTPAYAAQYSGARRYLP
jgi:gamma-D-glutamyl-L-lysine dipeptidyl-peptidase